MTSSGFESFDQAFNQIRIQNQSRNEHRVSVTHLDDEIYGVLNDNLCDLAGWLVQDDTEVVLCGDESHIH